MAIEISKNARETIHVGRRRYKGHDLVDVRCYVPHSQTGEPVPTRKGVCCSPEVMAEVVQALRAVLAGEGTEDV